MGKKCQTCRWWGGNRERFPLDERERGTCDRIHIGSGNREPPARLYPVGGDAWLETADDFGCVLWEKARETGNGH